MLHVLLDAVVICISYVTAWWIQFNIIVQGDRGFLPVQVYMSALIFIVPGFLLLYYAFNLYMPKRVQGRRLEMSNIFLANVMGLLGVFFVLFLVKAQDFSRPMLFMFIAINFTLTFVERNLIRLVLRNIRSHGMNLKHIILVGYSKAAEAFIDRVSENPQWGYQINGILDDNYGKGSNYKDVKVIGACGDLEEILEKNLQDEIVITLGLSEYYKLRGIVAACEKSGVHTKFVPDYETIIPTRPYTEDLLGLPVINIRHVPLTDTFNRAVKRAMDIAGSLFCILLF